MGINSKIKDYFETLGMEKRQIDVYLSLVHGGAKTVLELSKETDLPRTGVYRVVDSLLELGLIEEILDQNTKRYSSSGFNKIELLIKQKELENKYLKDYLEEVSGLLSGSLAAKQPGTKVLFYRGVEGIKQEAWNILSSKDTVRSYAHDFFAKVVGQNFSQKWNQEFSSRGLVLHEIVPEKILEISDKSILEEWLNWEKSNSFKTKMVSDKKLKINNVIDIYDDVIAFHSWEKHDLVGVEIYNEKIAELQKQLFDIVWDIAKPISRQKLLQDSI